MPPESNFVAALRAFHGRNWRADVAHLNSELARRPDQGAGLEVSPPSIITGDPFSLQPRNCVLVIGINPGWPSSPRRKAADCEPARFAWERGFNEYCEHRRPYFAEQDGLAGRTKNADSRYNGHHFSRLGNTLAMALGVAVPGWNPGPTARSLFRDQAAIFDLLPYWSENTKNLNLSLARPAKLDCIRDWRRVIESFIAEKEPIAVIVNNSGQRPLVSNLLGCELAPLLDTGFYGGRLEGVGGDVPALSHPFLGGWRGITRADYVARFSRAARIVGLELPLQARQD